MSSIVQSARQTTEKILEGALLPLRDVLTPQLIECWCREAQYLWRDRRFTPTLTLLAFLYQCLTGSSTRAAEDWLLSLSGIFAKSPPRDGSGFCAARRRIPLSVFAHMATFFGAQATKASARVCQGLNVLLVDGTTLRLQGDKALSDYYGHSKNQVRRSRSPLARMVALVCAGTGAVIDLAVGAYASSEMALFGKILERLPEKILLIGDTLYSAYVIAARVRMRNSHLLSRLHPRRKGTHLEKLGYQDERRRFDRPRTCSQKDWLAGCPESMDFRVLWRTITRKGYRSYELKLVTTLLDPEKYPADMLIDLYLERWHIETDLRALKQEYKMAKLSCHSPEAVEREIYGKVAAYNAVLMLMARSGESVRNLSQKRAREWLIRTAERMVEAPTCRLPELHKQMLARIGESLLDKRERPAQPRAIIQRPSTFPVLMTSRKDWQEKYLLA